MSLQTRPCNHTCKHGCAGALDMQRAGNGVGRRAVTARLSRQPLTARQACLSCLAMAPRHLQRAHAADDHGLRALCADYSEPHAVAPPAATR